MFEQSSRSQLIQLILDHPRNCGLDPHERSALSKRLSCKNLEELDREYDTLPAPEKKTGFNRARFF